MIEKGVIEETVGLFMKVGLLGVFTCKAVDRGPKPTPFLDPI